MSFSRSSSLVYASGLATVYGLTPRSQSQDEKPSALVETICACSPASICGEEAHALLSPVLEAKISINFSVDF